LTPSYQVGLAVLAWVILAILLPALFSLIEQLLNF